MKKQINILKIHIGNFRNITNAEFDFSEGKRIGIAGQNRIGKSNIIEAIHWLLTDYQLSGSSDIASFKRIGAEREAVEVWVDINIDGEIHRIEKRFAEKWTKTRGTDQETMTGHVMNYTIDDISYKTQKEALEVIRDLFGLSDVKMNSKIDVMRLLTNHLYLTEQLSWQDLRELIVDVIGDVTDEDVISRDLKFSKIAEKIRQFRGDTKKATVSLKQAADETKSEITRTNAVIEEYKNTSDVTAEDLKKAQEEIERCDSQIAELRAGMTIEDPRIKELSERVSLIKEQYSTKKAQELEANIKSNESSNASLMSAQTALQNAYKDQSDNTIQMSEARKKISSVETEICQLENEISLLVEKVNGARAEYSQEQQKQFELSDEIVCKHCGMTANYTDEEKKHLEELFNSNKKLRVSEIVRKGCSLNEEISNLRMKIESKREEIESVQNQLVALEQKEKAIDESIQKLLTECEKWKSTLTVYQESSELTSIGMDLKSAEKELYDIKYGPKDTTANDALAQIQALKNSAQAIIREHEYYLTTQKKIEQKQCELRILLGRLTEVEEKQILLQNFIRTKLSMLNENVKKVFGDIQFILVDEAIKEGSWRECCYPLIKGKETPFKDGSTSEKILTGIAIIERIKQAKKLPNMPILFDEGEALDENTVATLLDTESQVITALVRNEYKKPTVIKLG